MKSALVLKREATDPWKIAAFMASTKPALTCRLTAASTKQILVAATEAPEARAHVHNTLLWQKMHTPSASGNVSAQLHNSPSFQNYRPFPGSTHRLWLTRLCDVVESTRSKTSSLTQTVPFPCWMTQLGLPYLPRLVRWKTPCFRKPASPAPW